MKPKTLLAGFAWLNWYAITWLILFSAATEPLLAGLAWLIFLFIAMIATFAKEQTK